MAEKLAATPRSLAASSPLTLPLLKRTPERMSLARPGEHIQCAGAASSAPARCMSLVYKRV
uniref:Uncharacterized protein n=1 Tax=Thermogemmatispora argillosa TaxID=2045280 RepID=A0A455T4K2_9CHLR|nr:hypothetical protein KTA_25280 [Thermogemmatispora argillosa]